MKVEDRRRPRGALITQILRVDGGDGGGGGYWVCL